MSSAKTSRWLDLVAFLLQHRFPVTREDIFSRVGGYDGAFESERRKFERDKDELRKLGIEIETVDIDGAASDEAAKGYRLRPRQAYLPYLELVDEPTAERAYKGLDTFVLTRDELDVLDRATRTLASQADGPFAAAAASARRKLAFDLPLAESSVQAILAHPIPEHAREALAVLQEGLMQHRAVRCRYFTMSRRTEEERELEPWGLLFQWARWYCVARARDRDEPRVFRVDRMRDVKLLTEPDARFAVPDDFDVRDFAGRAPWEFSGASPVTCTVRFAFPESRWVINRGVGRILRDRGDEGAELEFDVRDTDAFLRWLLPFGRRAVVTGPERMAADLDTLRAEVAALYAEHER